MNHIIASVCCFLSISNQSRHGNSVFLHFHKNKQNSPRKQITKTYTHTNTQRDSLYQKLGKIKGIYITAMQTTETEESITLFPNHFWSPGHGSFTGHTNICKASAPPCLANFLLFVLSSRPLSHSNISVMLKRTIYF